MWQLKAGRVAIDSEGTAEQPATAAVVAAAVGRTTAVVLVAAAVAVDWQCLIVLMTSLESGTFHRWDHTHYPL